MRKKSISLNVQKWEYERGNYQLVVDNAWSLRPLYSQERITINGERIRDRIETNIPILFWRTFFEDTILDSNGELNLKLQLKSGLWSVSSRLLVENEKQPWTHYAENKWTGAKGEWPGHIEYESWNS